MRFFASFRRIATSIAAILMVPALSAEASLIQVPADAPTITAGIAVAAPGDTVLIDAGSYQENIDFQGKDIVVASHYILSGDTTDILTTIIDGSSPGHPDTTSCVLFHNGEGPAAILQGFTITGGTGTVWVDPEWPDWIWRGGGGVFIFGASPTIANNRITGNRATDEGQVDGAQGGGILCFQGDPRVVNNTICANVASYGGGLAIDYAGGQFLNNLFKNNSGGTAWGGGAIWTIGSWSAPIVIENNTIVNNDSPTYAGALYIWGSTITARNNIIWGNTQVSGNPIHRVNGGNIDLTYSDVEGYFAGTGNIDADPGFVDGENYYLDGNSPCVDAGHPDAQYEDPEDPEYPGQAMWPALGTRHNDMGCYGGPECCVLPCENATAVGDQGSAESEQAAGVTFSSLSCYPNPLGEETTVSFRLPRAAEVSLSVFDIKGRRVATLLNVHCEAGTHQANWNGRDQRGDQVPGGLYFLRLRSAGRETTGKVILMR